MERWKNFINKYRTVFWIILLLAVWEMASRLGLVNKYILPPFSQVFMNMISEIFHKALGLQILNSLRIIIEGFLISVFGGIAIGVLCIWSKTIESLFQAISMVMNPLPGIAILPLVMMWFGIGNGAMIFLIIHGVLWPLITNFIEGFKSIPQIYKEWGLNIGLKPAQMMLHIYLPAIMPNLLAGLRIGWGRAWRALISAEMIFGMIGTLGGLGYYIYQNRAYANMTNVLSGVLVIVIIGILVDHGIFGVIEKNTLEKWGGSQ